MHIRRLDPAGDPADLAAVLPAYQAACLEAMPGFPAPETAKLLLIWVGPGYRQRSVVFGAFADEGDAVAQGVAIVGFELNKNPDLAWTDLCVPAEARARGVDVALFDAAIRVASEEGRRRISTAFSDAVPAPAGFVERYAGKHTDTAIRSALDLRAMDRSRFERLAAPSEKNSQYTFISWDHCPQEYTASFCAALDAMADQPLGEYEYDFGKYETERLRFAEARCALYGVRRYTLAAVDPSGEVAGYTLMFAFPDEPEVAEIAVTGVVRHHRGHGLGLRLKAAASLWLAEDRPETRWITTFNNDENKWMLDVNRTLGYQATERWPGYEFPVGS